MPDSSRRRRLFRFPWRTGREIRRDNDEELAFHLEMRARELVERGMSPRAAADEARRQFGDLEYTKVYCQRLDARQEREARAAEWLSTVGQDMAYAARS